MLRTRKLTIENLTGKRIDGIITNQPIELTDQQVEAVAEGILQVLYNMGIYSNVSFEYDLKIDGGTKYYVHGTDVVVAPTNADSYNRRIRNDAKVIQKDKKDDNFLKEMEKMQRDQ